MLLCSVCGSGFDLIRILAVMHFFLFYLVVMIVIKDLNMVMSVRANNVLAFLV